MRRRSVIQFIFLLFCIATLYSSSFAQKLTQDPKLIKGTLKNGFTYYIYPNNNPAKQSVLRLFVNVGSLQEEDDQQGLAHFVEHMAFNGTKNYSKNEVISFLESKGVRFGADLNAHTSFDETVYKIDINTEENKNLEKAIDIMADWAFGVTFDSLDIEKERGVVMEEWRSKQGAANRLRDQYLPVLFHHSRYAERMPIGKVDILQHFPRQRIVDFYEKWYRPELMAIAVVTDINPDLVKKYIQDQFGGYKNKSAAKRIYYSLPEHKDTLTAIVTDKEATATELSFFTKMPSLTNIASEKVFKEYLFRIFLNNLAKARFARIGQLNNDFKSASLSVSNLIKQNAILAGDVALFNDQVKEGIESFLMESERIYRYGYTNEEIEKLKKEYLQQLQKSAESDKTISGTYAELISDDFYNGNAVISKKEKLRLVTKYLPAIDSAALLYTFQSLRTKGNTVLLLTASEQEKSKLPNEAELRNMISMAGTKQVTAWNDFVSVPDKLLSSEPMPGKIVSEKELKEVGVTEWILSNGVKVYFKPSDEQKNNIMLSGFREGGIYAVDSSKFITALFTKSILAASGAGNFSRRALSQYLAGNSASATLVLSNSREGVVAGAELKDIKTMFQLLYLKWTAPRVDAAVFDQAIRKAMESADNSKLAPNYEYNSSIRRMLAGDDDYVADTITSHRIRDEVKMEDLVPVFKSRFYSARGFQFVIVGNYNKDSLKALIEQYIGALPGADIKTKYVYKGASGGNEQEDLVMYAGQAPRSIVNLFFQSSDVTYDYPYIIQQQVLQEVLEVKLRMNLREENSGVYGVNVSVSATNKPADLLRARINFTCAPEAAMFLSSQAKEEISRIAKDPSYFAIELERIKTQLKDQYKKQAGKNSFWSAGLRNHFYHGFTGWEYFTDYEKLLEGITAKQIADMANKYLVQTPCIKAVLLPESFSKNNSKPK